MLLPSSTLPQVIKRSKLLRWCASNWRSMSFTIRSFAVPSEVSLLFFSPSRLAIVVDHASWRSEVVASSISRMISGNVVASDSTARSVDSSPGCENERASSSALPWTQPHAVVVDHHQRAVAIHDLSLGGAIERHDRYVLVVDVQPDVKLGPV